MNAEEERALRESHAELLAALEAAIVLIRTWHGMGAWLSDTDEEQAWNIYLSASPEMQSLNAAIKKAESL